MAPPTGDPEARGYRTHLQTVAVGGVDYTIRSLRDLEQYWDPDGAARARGITETTWSHFGHVWPAGVVLAEEIATRPLCGERVLELGCGLALAAMVAHRRQADVTACDRHPLSGSFLQENLRLNGLPPLTFHTADWDDPHVALGAFDLIIGSDLLYDHVDPANLVRFIARHASPTAEILVVDLGRRRLDRFTGAMAAAGFDSVERRAASAPRSLIAQFRRA